MKFKKYRYQYPSGYLFETYFNNKDEEYGFYKSFWKNRNKSFEGYYLRGHCGIWKEWHINGFKYLTITYKNSVINGIKIRFKK